MLKVNVNEKKVNCEELLTVSADVGQETLNLFSKLDGPDGSVTAEKEIKNNGNEIAQTLKEYEGLASRYKLKGLKVVCEPTGDYHRKLLTLAQKAGHQTAFVSGQAVNRMGVVETNDTGKTDHKDPKVINTLCELGKTLVVRKIDDDYRLLRLLNEMYENEDKMMIETKNRIHHALNLLFPDWSLKMNLVYGLLGEGIWKVYQFNPAKIVAGGRARFESVVNKHSPRTWRKTRDKIWECAVSSCQCLPAESEQDFLERQLSWLLDQKCGHERKKEEIKEEMLVIYGRTEEGVKLTDFDVVDSFSMARLIAETGPLKDFTDHDKLLRYVGLNLRERESGKFAGKLKITKRGRSLYRKVLYQVALRLVAKKGSMFQARHKENKKRLGGGKALVSLMRFLTRSILGVYRSTSKFDLSRLFLCESVHADANAA